MGRATIWCGAPHATNAYECMHADFAQAHARLALVEPTLLTPGGALQDNFGDIDDGADIGLVDMPYPLGDDLLQSHMASISGVKPCGACDE